MQQHLPAVRAGTLPPEILPALQPVDQLDDGVMAQLQALGNFADARLAVGGKAPEREHEHVLLRLKTRVAGGLLASIQENPDPVTELR